MVDRGGVIAVGARTGAHLTDRHQERAQLDRMVMAARTGASGVLVVKGAPGIGKTALLDYLLGHASGCRIVRAESVESEVELAYSGLHQLCAPLLEHLDRLPGPQRDAMATAFGLIAGTPPDKFLVGLAVLSLLSDAAEPQPLVCLVDDAQWLDRVSAQVLGFVARRLAAESVVLVFAAREGTDLPELSGLPELIVAPLPDHDARSLIDSAINGRLDSSVRDRIVAEARGNPLALLELPTASTVAAIAGGYGLPDTVTVPAKIEASFRHRLDGLPESSRQLLLVAAAEPVGDRALIRSAADHLGVPPDAAAPAVAVGLLDGRSESGFRHPLVRSVVYRAADPAARRRAHAALAEATDPESDPDRWAWHLAAASTGSDDGIADALERAAGRARGRGGMAAEAAFLRRSATLTPHPGRFAARILAAAQASFRAGAFDDALDLLHAAERATTGPAQDAMVGLMRAQVTFASGFDADAPPMLAEAARRMQAFDAEQAKVSYLVAWVATVFAGRSAGDRDLEEVSRSILISFPPEDEPGALDLLLTGLAQLVVDGHAVAASTLQRAAIALLDLPADDVVRWGWAATAATNSTWDPEGTLALAESQTELLRRLGALGQLPLSLAALGSAAVWTGDLAGAARIHAEASSVAAATRARFPNTVALRLAAASGDERETRSLMVELSSLPERDEQGLGSIVADWAAALLYNGLGRYEEALAAALRVTSPPMEPFVSTWALPELIEAAARAGRMEPAREAVDRLSATTGPSGTHSALGIEARSRAIVSRGDAAESLYRSAIDHLGVSPLRPDLARARLLYGEWLRREGRRLDARTQLRAAFDEFTAMGMSGFAERSRRELLTTGERVRRRGDADRQVLTPQEDQIAALARDGLSNQEIGAHLFLSSRTVEWHLHKVFGKLGIASRRELRDALGRGRGS